MPTLNVDNFNVICTTLGGFITVFGLVSYLLKEKFYLSEALISTIAGIVFGPNAAHLIRPLEYANYNAIDLETITLYFTRLVLGVQLVLAGVQLPSKYLWKEWKSLSILLGPGMCIMWLSTSLLVWALVPDISFLMAISVGACVTPTDPVLSNGIVKGKFADKNIPPPLQKIIIAESGANDGLGYPFLFIGLYLLKYTNMGGAGQEGGAREAIGLWFGETWGYQILLSVAYGAVVGWVAKELLHWAEERRYVDRESFLVFAITLALFIVGTVGMIGSDDVLACFVAGNSFTWDDWFRLETMDDSLQPTIDMLLNVAVFMWFGAVCPWHEFAVNDVIPIGRLIALGVLVLLLRRLPMVLAFHKRIHQIEDLRRAGFVGFFGPIGVSAIFYLYTSREFLREIEVDGVQRQDAQYLSDVMYVVIWFLTVCSILIHGLSIPVGKLGIQIPRTISTALSSERLSYSVSRNISRSRSRDSHRASPQESSAAAGLSRRARSTSRNQPGHGDEEPRLPDGESSKSSDKSGWTSLLTKVTSLFGRTGNDKGRGADVDVRRSGRPLTISSPRDGRVIGRPIVPAANQPESRPGTTRTYSQQRTADSVVNPGINVVGAQATERGLDGVGSTATPPSWNRTIRFGDQAQRVDGGVSASGSVPGTPLSSGPR